MSGDTFGAEELELRRAVERSAPFGVPTADILAETCEAQRHQVGVLRDRLIVLSEACLAQRAELRDVKAEYDTLAQAHAEQLDVNRSWAQRQQRDFDALDSAGIHCLRGGSEEVGDGICRLAGERDQYKSLLLSIARGIGVQPDAQMDFLPVVQRALQLAAKAGEQMRTIAQQDARLRSLELLVAEKTTRIAELERIVAAAERAIDGATERLRAR